MLVGAFYSLTECGRMSASCRDCPSTAFSLCSWAFWGPETGLLFLSCLLESWTQLLNSPPPALTGVQESGTW